MKIKRVYIGGWFQRTTLHLSEIYDFLRSAESNLELNQEKLKEFQINLNIDKVTLKVDGLEYVELFCQDGITIKIQEDGLIVLRCDFGQEDNLEKDIETLKTYYENKLSPAFNYLFSLGASVPKELANIKTVYPYFVVIEDSTNNEVIELLEKLNEYKYFEIIGDDFDLFRGDKFYIVQLKKEGLNHCERFIEEQIFMREFKGQLHHYLNLHRIIWERIETAKEKGNIKGKEIGSFRDKVQGYAKTINLIETRINQMGTYLQTRERIVKNNSELVGFIGLLEYKYETLGDTLSYVQEIWKMTKNYVDSALDLFTDLQAQATQNSVNNLTVVTSMGVGATLIGLFTSDTLPQFTAFGLGYFVILAIVGFCANKLIKWFYSRKLYDISDVDYDKNIK